MANLQKGISAVRIYDESDKPIMIVKISEQCRRTRELMKGDFIKLSWDSDEFHRLGTGCHIYYGTAELDKANPAFYLLNPYEPTRKAEDCYTYEPEFHAREDLWQKYPACIYTYGDNKVVKGRELEWSFLGTPQDALSIVEQSVLNETGWRLETSHIGSVSEKGGTSAVDLQAQSMSIFEMLGKIAQALDTEWRYDVEQNRIILGEYRLDTDHYPIVTMKVGVDCDNPQVNQTKEDYFNRFYVFGSDKNIQQQQIEEISNSAVKKRLPLDSAKYPGGFMDLDILNRKDLEGNEKDGWNLPKGAVYTPTQTDKSKIFPKGLYFDDVYPSTKFFIKSILENGSDHKQYLRDENGNIIGDTYYVAVSLDRKSDNIWDGFDLSKVLPGETIEMYWTSGILNGRKFELSVHPQYFRGNTYFYLTPDQNGALTTPNKYLKPEVGDEVTFFGYDFGGIGFDNARLLLERTATKYLYEMVQNTKTYTIKGNVPKFVRNCERDIRYACMPLGQQIIIDYGNGDVSEVLRVTKVDGALDIPSEMTITASAKADPKGALTALTETVELNKRTAEKKIEDYKAQAITYAQRNFTQVYETMNQINNYFGDEIQTTKTMQSVTGDPSLQVVFSKTPDFITTENPAGYWDSRKNPPCFALKMYPDDERYFYVKHMTLGVTEISSPSRVDGQRMVWRLKNQYTEWENDDQRLVYLKCAKLHENGTQPSAKSPASAVMILSSEKLDIDMGDSYYFLLGFLSAANEAGERSFSPMYGYTEILPGQITTSMIVSDDGNTYFDIKNGKIGGNIDFQDSVITETILIKNGVTDSEGNPYYIGGISGAKELPTIWTGVSPTTDESIVKTKANEELPVKLTKEGIGSNIGCLQVTDAKTIDVRGTTNGGVRITAKSIVDEMNAQVVASIGKVTFPDREFGVEINNKTGYTIDSRQVYSRASAINVECKVSAVKIHINQTYLSQKYNIRAERAPKNGITINAVLKMVVQKSSDNVNWTDVISVNIYNKSVRLSQGKAPNNDTFSASLGEKTTTIPQFSFQHTGASLYLRIFARPSCTLGSTLSNSEKSAMGALTLNVQKGVSNPTQMYSFNVDSTADNPINVLASGGLMTSLNTNNYFRVFPSGSTLNLDFKGKIANHEISTSSGEHYIVCRGFGGLVFIKYKLLVNEDRTCSPIIPPSYCPNMSLDFVAYGGYYGTVNNTGIFRISNAPSGETIWGTLMYIN